MSDITDVIYGVPRGSVPGPILFFSVLPRLFLQGGTPCPFQEAEMTPCRLLVTSRDALLYFTWPRTSQSAVIGAETMRFPYFGIRHRNPTHI